MSFIWIHAAGEDEGDTISVCVRQKDIKRIEITHGLNDGDRDIGYDVDIYVDGREKPLRVQLALALPLINAGSSDCVAEGSMAGTKMWNKLGDDLACFYEDWGIDFSEWPLNEKEVEF